VSLRRGAFLSLHLVLQTLDSGYMVPLQTNGRGGDIIATQQDTGAESLTALEAARRLGVDKSTVVRWLQEDKLAGYRTLGGHWRIPVAEVDRVRSATD
jgi:excisionase family DNA binding protein